MSGAQELTGDNLKVAWDKFSTLSWAVFVISVIAWQTQARPHLELKIQSRLCPVSLSLSIHLRLVYTMEKIVLS